MTKKTTEAIFLGIEVDGIKYQIGDEDMPEKVSPWKALLKVYERKKFLESNPQAG